MTSQLISMSSSEIKGLQTAFSLSFFGAYKDSVVELVPGYFESSSSSESSESSSSLSSESSSSTWRLETTSSSSSSSSYSSSSSSTRIMTTTSSQSSLSSSSLSSQSSWSSQSSQSSRSSRSSSLNSPSSTSSSFSSESSSLSSVSSPSSSSTPTSLSSMSSVSSTSSSSVSSTSSSSVSSPSSSSTPTSLSSSTSSSSVSSTSISSPQSVIAEEGQTILISGGKLVYYPTYDGYNESGDYIYEDTWIKVSNDSGVTWSDPIGLPLSGGFYSNMLMSSNGQFITVVFSENWWKAPNSPAGSHSQKAKVYCSNDSGAHFYQSGLDSTTSNIGVDSERYYGSGACSSDGQFQTIVFSNGQYIFTNNYGQDNWYVSYGNVGIEKFKSIYMSKDGTTEIIAGRDGIYQRGPGPGAFVKLRASLPGFQATEPEAIANFNGTQGVLALSTNSLDNYNEVWLSKDGANGSYYAVHNFPLGNSPYYTDMNRYLPCVASSIDGKYMIVAKTKVFISYNYGVDWVEKTELLYTTSLSMSGSGKYIVATGFDGPFEETRVNKVRYSSDYGHTWTDSHAPDLLQNLGEINRCLISSGIPY